MPTRTNAAFWVDIPAEVSFEDGTAHWTLRSGAHVFEFRATAATMLGCVRNGGKAYAAFIGDKASNVVRFKRKRRKRHKDHAA